MHDKASKSGWGQICNGGKANISELMLFCTYGFSVWDAFKIPSINGAKALGIDESVGAIVVGKKADLIIWDKSPFDDIENFKSKKTIIKSGKVFQALMALN